ncbi:FAD-binding oxidoreductase [Aquimarina addita]|uniref:FAD-binding oxidoreductase n=1 Tax=Aquimarina addita TaxID=870485 RepID=A0ABP6UVV8_9FLAO
MKEQKNRREVLKLLALSGFSVFLPSCLHSEKKTGNGAATSLDTTVKDTIASFEEAVTVNDVVYFRKTDKEYDELRQSFNLNVQKFPLIIALCKNTVGVAAAIKLANAEGLKVAVKSGGHSFESFSSIDNGLQINLSLLKSTTWNDDQTVTIEPACTLKEMYDELLPKNRIIPAGSCATVGIGGLTLGGGYGFFARKYGLTCDHLIEAILVDGLGNVHTTKTGEELMWALRGGGNGNLGVVTKLTFKTHKVPYGFTRHRFKAYKLDKERTKELLQAYFKYSAALPESCFAAFVLNYKTMVLLITNYGEDNEPLREMLDAFSTLADKTSIGTKKNLAVSLRNYYGIQHPIYFKNASAGYYKGYESIETSIDAVLNVVFRKRGLIYQINTLGGAINTPEFESNSCYPHRNIPYLSELQAYWEEGKNPEVLIESFEEIQGILYDHGIKRQYRNYPHKGFKDWETAYYGDNYKKLQEIKKKYDPNDVFSHEQTVKLKKY